MDAGRVSLEGGREGRVRVGRERGGGGGGGEGREGGGGGGGV